MARPCRRPRRKTRTIPRRGILPPCVVRMRSWLGFIGTVRLSAAEGSRFRAAVRLYCRSPISTRGSSMRAIARPAPALRSRALVGLWPLLLLVTACSLDGVGGRSSGGFYDVTIRRDGYGVPHIVAADYGSLRHGGGLCFAPD